MKAIDIIRERKQISAHELAIALGISRQAIFKQLNKLVEKGEITKLGRAPKVFYAIAEKKESSNKKEVMVPQFNLIEKNYLFISPLGEVIYGMKGFQEWCERNGFDVVKFAHKYEEIFKKNEQFRVHDLIDGMPKMKSTFKEVYLDEVYYLDFYSIEIFGKTKLGNLLLYAKQSQNLALMKKIFDEIKMPMLNLIKTKKIDALGFVPPTVKRELQFMRELQRNFSDILPIVKLTKLKQEIVVPQKTLVKLADRIENARKSILVEERDRYKRILLIDDAIGSGATLNEVARNLRENGLGKDKIVGLALTGSFKGFDVISEV